MPTSDTKAERTTWLIWRSKWNSPSSMMQCHAVLMLWFNLWYCSGLSHCNLVDFTSLLLKSSRGRCGNHIGGWQKNSQLQIYRTIELPSMLEHIIMSSDGKTANHAMVLPLARTQYTCMYTTAIQRIDTSRFRDSYRAIHRMQAVWANSRRLFTSNTQDTLAWQVMHKVMKQCNQLDRPATSKWCVLSCSQTIAVFAMHTNSVQFAQYTTNWNGITMQHTLDQVYALVTRHLSSQYTP